MPEEFVTEPESAGVGINRYADLTTRKVELMISGVWSRVKRFMHAVLARGRKHTQLTLRIDTLLPDHRGHECPRRENAPNGIDMII